MALWGWTIRDDDLTQSDTWTVNSHVNMKVVLMKCMPGPVHCNVGTNILGSNWSCLYSGYGKWSLHMYNGIKGFSLDASYYLKMLYFVFDN